MQKSPALVQWALLPPHSAKSQAVHLLEPCTVTWDTAALLALAALHGPMLPLIQPQRSATDFNGSMVSSLVPGHLADMPQDEGDSSPDTRQATGSRAQDTSQQWLDTGALSLQQSDKPAPEARREEVAWKNSKQQQQLHSLKPNVSHSHPICT